MGRYWNSINHNGKFGFAVQPSNDPEVFGMEEQEPTEITYYLDGSKEKIDSVKRKINEQYDILGISEADRIYKFERIEEVYKLIDGYKSKNYKPFKPEKHKGKIPYHDELTSGGIVPVKDSIPLAECRLVLGLCILDDLEKDGYCELNAEV